MKHKILVQTIIFIFALLLVGAFYLLINTPSSIILSQPFSISKGEPIASISSRLKQENFIYSDLLFRFYLKIINKTRDIKAGYYLFPPRISLVNLINIVTDSTNINDGIFLVKEGETLLDIDNHFREKNIINDSQNIANYTIKDFIKKYPDIFPSTPLNNNLEGYLFPDSYHFPQGLSSSEIIEAFLANFETKLNDAKLLAINNGHSFYENLIIASLLEKEVQSEIEKRMVADILWRRLKENMPLQVDATICYAQNQSFSDCQLTEKAFKTNSPYNTYLYKGLPPTPICNPGLESIGAALNPLPNQSWYYLTDKKTGRTIFSKTYEEHRQARGKYL